MITVTELTDERFVQIDSIINQSVVDKFIDAATNVETELLNENIDASEIYSYLLTILLNQC